MFFKKLSLAAIILVAFLFVSCKKDSDSNSVTADFSYSGAGMAPATVSFTNTSTGATSYLWDFGDNTTSTSTSPSHTYTKGGVYTVKLTATGGGASHSTTKTVNITAPTSVKITGFKVLAMPATAPSGGGWDVGSGPDLYFRITDANNVPLYTAPTYFQNVTTSNLPLSWSISPPYSVPSLTSILGFDLLDEDSPASSDFMGGYYVNFSTLVNQGYPSTYLIQNSQNPSLKFELTLLWQ